MDVQACRQVGIRYEEGVARFVGNAEMYESFLRQFPSDQTYAEIEEAMKQKDFRAAFQAAHTLKGLSGNLSLGALYDSLVVFVDALRGEGNPALAESLFPAVQENYRKTVAFLNAQS